MPEHHPVATIDGLWSVTISDAAGSEINGNLAEFASGRITGLSSGKYTIIGALVRGSISFSSNVLSASITSTLQFEAKLDEHIMNATGELHEVVSPRTDHSSQPQRVSERRLRVTADFRRIHQPTPLDWTPYPLTEEIRNSQAIVRFIREHPAYHSGKDPDPVFNDTRFHRQLGSEFKGSVYIDQSATTINVGPADVFLHGVSNMIVAFGGPAALGAFLKYSFDKIIQWKGLSNSHEVEVTLDDITVRVKGSSDLEQAMEKVEHLMELREAKNAVSTSTANPDGTGSQNKTEEQPRGRTANQQKKTKRQALGRATNQPNKTKERKQTRKTGKQDDTKAQTESTDSQNQNDITHEQDSEEAETQRDTTEQIDDNAESIC
jgi:hypothetical protein